MTILLKFYHVKRTLKKEIWILGHVNVDFLKRDHVNTKKFLSFFKTFGLNQVISDITRQGISHGTCIDWIITNSKFVSSAKVTTIFLSDHFAIDCVKKKARERYKNVYRILRDYKNYNRENLIQLFKDRLSLENVSVIDDPNLMWDLIHTHIYEILSVMCPLKRYKQRENPTPWINADIYKAMRYRDSLVNLFKATQNSLYMTLVRHQRNIVNSLTESAKRTFIMTTLRNNISVPKSLRKLYTIE